MRTLWLGLALAGFGCTPKESPDASTKASVEQHVKPEEDAPKENKPEIPIADRRVIPDPLPSGDLSVIYDCSHSMEPFGKGYSSRSTTFDVARGVLRYHAVSSDGEPANDAVTKSELELTEPQARELRAAVDRMLAGGPYRAVYPVSEGLSCSLMLRTGADAPFLTIERAESGEGCSEDLVDRVITALRSLPAK